MSWEAQPPPPAASLAPAATVIAVTHVEAVPANLPCAAPNTTATILELRRVVRGFTATIGAFICPPCRLGVCLRFVSSLGRVESQSSVALNPSSSCMLPCALML